MVKMFKNWRKAMTNLVFLSFLGFGFTSQPVFADDDLPGSVTVGNSGVVTPTRPGVGNSIGHLEMIPGELTLSTVPNFDFGAHNLYQADTYSLRENLDTKTRLLSVFDQSDGDQGWRVTVAISDFVDNTDPNNIKKFPFTKLDFNNANILKKASTDPNDLWEDGSNADFRPNAMNQIELFPPASGASETHTGDDGSQVTTGSSQEIWSANPVENGQTSGKGAWALDFADRDSVKLHNDKMQQQVGSYKATLFWSLQAGPTTSVAAPFSPEGNANVKG